MHNFTVQSGVTLTLTGCAYPRPLIIAATGAVEIQGTIDVSAFAGPYAGAGGSPPCGQILPLGNGGGGVGQSTNYPNSSAGGGSFCSPGGSGAVSSGTVAPGGSLYGTATLVPLVAGSAGGNNNGGGRARVRAEEPSRSPRG
jgi:hypothetical protein